MKCFIKYFLSQNINTQELKLTDFSMVMMALEFLILLMILLLCLWCGNCVKNKFIYADIKNVICENSLQG
jgi:hypothetical protein